MLCWGEARETYCFYAPFLCHESFYDCSELSSLFSTTATLWLGCLCRQPHDCRDLADQPCGYLGANIISFPFCFCSCFVRLPFLRLASRMALISNTMQSFKHLAPRLLMLCSLMCMGPGSHGFPKMPPSWSSSCISCVGWPLAYLCWLSLLCQFCVPHLSMPRLLMSCPPLRLWWYPASCWGFGMLFSLLFLFSHLMTCYLQEVHNCCCRVQAYALPWVWRSSLGTGTFPFLSDSCTLMFSSMILALVPRQDASKCLTQALTSLSSAVTSMASIANASQTTACLHLLIGWARPVMFCALGRSWFHFLCQHQPSAC